MARRKLPYRNGSIFQVPLGGGAVAFGVCARHDGRGLMLVYFFWEKTPDLRAEQAVLVAQVGDLGLLEGHWQVVGAVDDFAPERWPVPLFRCYQDPPGRWVVRDYNDKLERVNKEVRVTAAEVEGLPDDGLYGYGAAVIELQQLLARSTGSAPPPRRRRAAA